MVTCYLLKAFCLYPPSLVCCVLSHLEQRTSGNGSLDVALQTSPSSYLLMIYLCTYFNPIHGCKQGLSSMDVGLCAQSL